ncbi:serine/threonine-protein kinase [Sorangium sp. So ce1151]|uniref:serine/threonine-protein kinase n=1 Tax=Sorangium sp. So ce1151 TaxID=3133332 RepID=UPI003F644E39
MEAPVRIGDVLLGKYTVERVLGQGGMGVVLAARHRELGELFAIKLLLPRAVADAHATERFVREARAAVRLKGEHTVRVHDVGRLESGSPYMVMEHLEGSDLQQIVRERGPLSVDEAVGYVLQVCDALAEAHAEGLVHRDLKPANLFLVRRPNGSPCVKVLDFGISKQIKQEQPELTRTGALLGSPFYMSPEQMIRARRVDTRSDIWAMGVVLHHLVTGMVPFPAETLPEEVARVLHEEPILPSEQRPGLPAELDAVVALCLQKRPEHRFQTVDELAAALRVLLSDGAPRSVAAAGARSGTVSALAETQAALAQPTQALPQVPARVPTLQAAGPAPTSDLEMEHTLSGSAERTAPAIPTTGAPRRQLGSLGRAAPVVGAALAVIGLGGGWLAQRQRSAPAAPPLVSQGAPAPAAPAAAHEAPAGEAAEKVTPGAADAPPAAAPPAVAPPAAAPAPAELPATSRPPSSAAPAGSASAPLRGAAPVRSEGLAASARPTTAVAGAAATTRTDVKSTPQRRKYEGVY